MGVPVYNNGYNNNVYTNGYNNGYNNAYGQNYGQNYGGNEVVIVDNGQYYNRNRGCLVTFIFILLIIALFNALYWTV